MNSKFIILTFFVFNFSLGQNVKEDSNFELKGSLIENENFKTIHFYYQNYEDVKVIDSSKIIDNNFIIKGRIKYPTLIVLCNNNMFSMTGTSSTQIFLEPKKMEIILSAKKFDDFQFKGSITQNENLKLKELLKNNLLKRDSISKIIKNHLEHIKIANDSTKRIIEKKLDILSNFMDENEVNETKIELKFIKQNLSSFIAPNVLSFKLNRSNGLLFQKTIDSIYFKLDKNVQNSPAGKKLGKTLQSLKNSAVGVKAPLFNLKDINGERISLETLKNKYILIDFWASWCGPCRVDFPFLKQEYLKYQNQGLEILSVSSDKNNTAWKNAIEKEDTKNWINVSLVENKSNLEESYFVKAIPVKVLINKEGVIIGRWRGGGDENKLQLENALKEIFSKK